MNTVTKYQAKAIYFTSVSLGLTLSLTLFLFTKKEIFTSVVLFVIFYCLLRSIYCYYKSKVENDKVKA